VRGANGHLGGQGGGWPGEFASLIGELRGIEYVPITFEIADGLSYWAAEVPGKAHGTGRGRRRPTVLTPSASSWEWGGRSSKHFPFDWEGPLDAFGFGPTSPMA
jgi:hypothetical protein